MIVSRLLARDHDLARARGTVLRPPSAVSSFGGFRTPAPVCAASPSWGRHPKPLYGAYRSQVERIGAVESFCHVTRLQLRTWRAPLLGCAKRSSPKAACGAPKARGLTANAQSEPS